MMEMQTHVTEYGKNCTLMFSQDNVIRFSGVQQDWKSHTVILLIRSTFMLLGLFWYIGKTCY